MSDEIWPPEQKADASRLYDFTGELASDADPATRQQVNEAKQDFERVKNPPDEIYLKDLPDEALFGGGRLLELGQSWLRHCPRAYWFPATFAVASVLVPRVPNVRVNLYCGLVGPVASGKSQTIEGAIQMLGVTPPQLMNVLAGSAEALIRETSNAAGNPRLFSPDELGHTLSKLQIERSSFSFVLNTAFYLSQFKVLMGKRQSANFDCDLSILGGLVEERFSELFNFQSTGGLHNRFLFGLCPGNFRYTYRPWEFPSEITNPIEVRIHPEVWEWRKEFEKRHPDVEARVVENSIRCATIAASFDDRPILRAKQASAWDAFSLYQHRIRAILQPNPGENFEAQLAHKFLQYLGRKNGHYVSRRELFRQTRAYDKGPTIAERALSTLAANGDVIETKVGKAVLVRLATDLEAELGESQEPKE
jgi:hypothetical protein